MTTAARVVAWLAAGHLVIGGLYWMLLQVPESTIWALTLSAGLAGLILVVAAIVETTAIRWWQEPEGVDDVQSGEARWRRILPGRSSLRALAGFALAAMLVVALYWVTGRLSGWWSNHGGEVEAWTMMRMRSPRAHWVQPIVRWAIWVLRYPVALSLAVGLLGAWLHGRVRPARWLARALHWRPILGITLALLIFVVLPWRYVYWRPASLPANWIELVFVGTKLSIVYLLINTGWAIVLSAGTRQLD